MKMNPKYNDNYLLACYYIKRLMFIVHSVPSFSEEFIDQLISNDENNSHPGTGRKFRSIGVTNKELDQFTQNSIKSRNRCWTTILMSLYMFHLMKDLSVQAVDYYLVDRSNLGSNLASEQHNNTQNVLYKFVCLLTNCTRLSSDKMLLFDLIRLPFFKLCLPNIAKYYNSVNLVDPEALLTFTTVAFGVVLIGVVLPIWNSVRPFPHSMLMFMVAPTTTTNRLHSQLRNLLEDLNDSWCNFMQDTTPIRMIDSRPNRGDNIDWYSNLNKGKTRSSNLFWSPNLGQNNSTLSRNKVLQDYLDECLPAIRTDWWRLMATRSIVLVLIGALSFTVTAFHFVIAFLDYRADRMKKVYRQFAQEMDRSGCKIWSQHESVGIDLANQDTDWSAWIGLDYILSYALMFSLSMLLTYFWVNQMELQCWLHEILDSCKLSVQLLYKIDEKYIVNLRRHFSEDVRILKRIPEEYHEERASSMCINIIRKEFMRKNKLDLYFRSNRSNEIKELETIEYLIADHDDIDDVIRFEYEILEKYYLSTRLFLLYMKEQENILAVILLASYSLNYGLAGMCMYNFAQTNNFGFESSMLILVGMLIANVLILIPSNYNAKVKRLQPLIWSMIARMTLKNHPRVKHLRTLWIKQATWLDDQKVLIAGPMGFKLDYIKLIQLVVWTVTFVLLAVR